jgi:hypothetical protein
MTRSPRHLREQVRDTVSELPVHAARLAVMGVGRALLLGDRVRKDYRDVRESGLGPVLGRLKDDAGAITGMVVGKISGNGKRQEGAETHAADAEISVGKPSPVASAQRPATPPRPAAAPPARPAAAKPTTPKPASKPASKPTDKPAASKLAASKPAAPKPATSKPTTPKPAVSKPTTPKPATSKPTTPKPAASKPTTPKPAASKSTTPEPAKPRSKATKPAMSTASGAKSAAKACLAAALPIAGYDESSLASVRARLRNLDAKQVAELRDYERAHKARADFLRMYENRIAKLRRER